jgi:hypothetical protein
VVSSADALSRALTLLSAVNVAFSFWIESFILGDAMYTPLKKIAEHSDFVFASPTSRM